MPRPLAQVRPPRFEAIWALVEKPLAPPRGRGRGEGANPDRAAASGLRQDRRRVRPGLRLLRHPRHPGAFSQPPARGDRSRGQGAGPGRRPRSLPRFAGHGLLREGPRLEGGPRGSRPETGRRSGPHVAPGPLSLSNGDRRRASPRDGRRGEGLPVRGHADPARRRRRPQADGKGWQEGRPGEGPESDTEDRSGGGGPDDGPRGSSRGRREGIPEPSGVHSGGPVRPPRGVYVFERRRDRVLQCRPCRPARGGRGPPG
jgi:hypothetical protein